MALTQQDVVDAAVALLDESGLAGITFRRLADRLGVRAPTLYWHVRDKRHLLDLMAAAIMGSADGRTDRTRPGPGQPWWEWMAERARGMRTALLAHPDGALVVAGNRPTEQSLPGVEQLLASLVRVGFTPGDALGAVFALASFVIGDAIETQAEIAGDGAVRQTDPGLVSAATSGRYPVLLAATETMSDIGDMDQRFEFGLALLIDGLHQRLVARPPVRPATEVQG